MSNQVNDENVGLLRQLVTTVQKKNDKEKVDNSIKMKPAKVIGVDEDTYKVFVYFIDDTEQNAYTFYNKSGEVLTEGDNVRVYYTTNPAKGWIGARCGEPVIKENNSGNSSTDTLTEYKYLSDKSVKCNGVTYTVEKDSATGLISKISDSGGNEFEPTVNSGITDTALHNAVFWAVAICRGFGSNSLFMPVRTGIGYYFDCGAATPKNNTWVNYMGSTSMALFNASKSSDGAVGFPLNSSMDNAVCNCGQVECDEPETMYIVAKIITQVPVNESGERWSVLFAKAMEQRVNLSGFSIVTDVDNYIYFGGMSCSVKSGVKADDYHIICATRNTDGYVDLYIDGEHIGTTPSATIHGNYGGYSTINFMHIVDGDSPYMKPAAAYKFVAIGSEYHESSDVLTNTKWLAAKYGITIN